MWYWDACCRRTRCGSNRTGSNTNGSCTARIPLRVTIRMLATLTNHHNRSESDDDHKVGRNYYRPGDARYRRVVSARPPPSRSFPERRGPRGVRAVSAWILPIAWCFSVLLSWWEARRNRSYQLERKTGGGYPPPVFP